MTHYWLGFLAHKEVLRLRYDDYVSCVSEHCLIGMKVFLEVQGENEPIMKTANISLSKPELIVQVSTPLMPSHLHLFFSKASKMWIIGHVLLLICRR